MGNLTDATENLSGSGYGDQNNITVAGAGDNTHTDYDFLNRPVTVTSPAVVDAATGNSKQPITTSTYDAAGNVTAVVDPRGYATHNVYDAINRLLSTTDGALNTVSYQYDTVGNRTKVTDGNGNATTFSYDGLKRNTNITDASSKTTTFYYDALNKLYRLDGNNAITGYTYDVRNRLQTVTYNNFPNDDRSYTYDPAGNLLSVIEGGYAGAADVAYTYDALNRVVMENCGGGLYNPASGAYIGGVTHTYA